VEDLSCSIEKSTRDCAVSEQPLLAVHIIVLLAAANKCGVMPSRGDTPGTQRWRNHKCTRQVLRPDGFYVRMKRKSPLIDVKTRTQRCQFADTGKAIPKAWFPQKIYMDEVRLEVGFL
jgi:hypothetical protein